MKIKNTIIAATAALALIAGQAAASNHSVVDRVGAPAEQIDNSVPIVLTALAAGIVLMVLVNSSRGDDSESD